MELLNCAKAGPLMAAERSRAKHRAFKTEKAVRNEQYAPMRRLMILILTFSEYSAYGIACEWDTGIAANRRPGPFCCRIVNRLLTLPIGIPMMVDCPSSLETPACKFFLGRESRSGSVSFCDQAWRKNNLKNVSCSEAQCRAATRRSRPLLDRSHTAWQKCGLYDCERYFHCSRGPWRFHDL